MVFPHIHQGRDDKALYLWLFRDFLRRKWLIWGSFLVYCFFYGFARASIGERSGSLDIIPFLMTFGFATEFRLFNPLKTFPISEKILIRLCWFEIAVFPILMFCIGMTPGYLFYPVRGFIPFIISPGFYLLVIYALSLYILLFLIPFAKHSQFSWIFMTIFLLLILFSLRHGSGISDYIMFIALVFVLLGAIVALALSILEPKKYETKKSYPKTTGAWRTYTKRLDDFYSNPVKDMIFRTILITVLYLLIMISWKIKSGDELSLKSIIQAHIIMSGCILFIMGNFFLNWRTGLRSLAILPISKGRIIFYTIRGILFCSCISFISMIIVNAVSIGWEGNCLRYAFLLAVLLLGGMLMYAVISLRFSSSDSSGLMIFSGLSLFGFLLYFPEISLSSIIIFCSFFLPVVFFIGIMSLKHLIFYTSYPFRNDGAIHSSISYNWGRTLQ